MQPQFNLSGINATTHPCAVLVLVNGPIGRELGVHGGPGCYGPGFRANATIGRAVRLLLLNIAGASPGLGDRATQGTPAKFALCLAENEEASPWAPFHTTRGFEPEDSTVTVAASEGPHNIQEHGSNTALGVLQTVVGALGQAGSNNILSRGEPLLALGPEHAATIADEGWTRERIQQYVYEHARYPASELSPEFLDILSRGEPLLALGPEHAATIADEGWTRERIQQYVYEHARYPASELSPEFLESVNVRIEPELGIEPFPPDALLPIVNEPEHLQLFVAGGPGKHSSWLPTFGQRTSPVTTLIADRFGRPVGSVEDLRG